MVINITNLDEIQKQKLRGAIRFFNGDKNNMPVFVKIGKELKSSGAIFCNEQIFDMFVDIVGRENCIIER